MRLESEMWIQVLVGMSEIPVHGVHVEQWGGEVSTWRSGGEVWSSGECGRWGLSLTCPKFSTGSLSVSFGSLWQNPNLLGRLHSKPLPLRLNSLSHTQ